MSEQLFDVLKNTEDYKSFYTSMKKNCSIGLYNELNVPHIINRFKTADKNPHFINAINMLSKSKKLWKFDGICEYVGYSCDNEKARFIDIVMIKIQMNKIAITDISFVLHIPYDSHNDVLVHIRDPVNIVHLVCIYNDITFVYSNSKILKTYLTMLTNVHFSFLKYIMPAIIETYNIGSNARNNHNKTNNDKTNDNESDADESEANKTTDIESEADESD